MKSDRDDFELIVTQLKERDRKTFLMGILALITMLALTAVSLYRWSADFEDRISTYKSELAVARTELAAVQKNAELQSERIRNMNTYQLKTLIEISAKQRQDIDNLDRRVSCLQQRSASAPTSACK